MKTHCAFTYNYKETMKKHFGGYKTLSALPGSTPAPVQVSPRAPGQIFLFLFAILCLSAIAALLWSHFSKQLAVPVQPWLIIQHLGISLFCISTCLNGSSIKINQLLSPPPHLTPYIFSPTDPEWANSKFLLPIDMNNTLLFLNTENNLCSSPKCKLRPSSKNNL